MDKSAKLINTGITDPAWGRPISVSASAWNYYIQMLNLEDDSTAKRFRESVRQSDRQGVSLRQIIAEDFANSAGRAVHYFKLGKKPEPGEADLREWGEIRNVVMKFKGSTKYFIAAIRSKSVDILVVQNTMMTPDKRRKTPTGI